MKQICFLIFFSVMLVPGCTFNKAIRGGDVVDSYAISKVNLPIEEVHYKNLDGTDLYAWFIKKGTYHQVPTIIFLHGSRGNIMDYLPVIKNLHQSIDANIFACDFPGTGASKGKMSLENTYRMTLAAIDYVAGIPDIRHDKIVLYGTSMGATLALYGASKREHVTVVLDSGVTSANDYVEKNFFIGLPDFFIKSFGENFDNYLLAKNMKNPKLFLHGTRDPFIDIKYARRLYGAASEPKDFLWMDGGHVLYGNPGNSSSLSEKINAFFDVHLPK
jgi:uncharacterized protein